MGIARDNKEKRNRICALLLWSSSTLYCGSRTQATIALSSAESELYALGTAAKESLYISNFIKEAFEVRTNIRIHTDSSAAKSIAMRRRIKEGELRHLFIQRLVKSKIITMHKIKSEDNTADIRTKFVGSETLNKHLCNVGL